jgi:aryl-alcohol dehydrogenase-like predicted oxidoreductase
MSDRTLSIDGVRVPRLLYGTAWKEDRTEPLTRLALREGFRGLDTANQRRHYHEAAAGAAVAAAIRDGLVSRGVPVPPDQVHLPRWAGPPPALRPRRPVAAQVGQSLAGSLDHLGTDVVDSFVLHGPTTRVTSEPVRTAMHRSS